MKREDLERLERKRSLEQDCDPTQALNSEMDFNMGGFPNLGAPGPLELEGDGAKCATCMHQSPNIFNFPCSIMHLKLINPFLIGIELRQLSSFQT